MLRKKTSSVTIFDPRFCVSFSSFKDLSPQNSNYLCQVNNGWYRNNFRLSFYHQLLIHYSFTSDFDPQPFIASSSLILYLFQSSITTPLSRIHDLSIQNCVTFLSSLSPHSLLTLSVFHQYSITTPSQYYQYYHQSITILSLFYT